MSKKLTLIRHCAIDSAFDGCYVGHMQTPLSNKGTRQATCLAKSLAGRGIHELWCSTMLRAQQTVSPIERQLGLISQGIDDLAEVNFGQWEGKTFAEILASDPKRVDAWAEMEEDFCFPGGESLAGFHARVGRTAKSLNACDSTHVAVVSHGGVIRALMCMLMGLSAKDYLKFVVNRGGFATLDLYSSGAVLTGLCNDPYI